jgi:hypothetical protein
MVGTILAMPKGKAQPLFPHMFLLEFAGPVFNTLWNNLIILEVSLARLDRHEGSHEDPL